MDRWHLGTEIPEPWPVAEHAAALALDPAKDFLMQKMMAITFNSHLTITGILMAAILFQE